MLHLAGGVGLGPHVGDLLGLERSLEGDGVPDAAAEEEQVAPPGQLAGEERDVVGPPEGCLDGIMSKLVTKSGECLLRFLWVDLHSPTEVEILVKHSQKQVGICDRRLLSSEAITGRSRDSGSTLRTHMKDSLRVHPTDTAPARTDRPDVNHRQFQPVSERSFRYDPCLPSINQGAQTRSPTHVYTN